MKLARMVMMLDIVFNAHVFNWFWRDSLKRRDVRWRVLSRAIPRYLKRYVPAPDAIPEETAIHDDKNEKIFTLWLQGEKNAPPLVQACFASVRKHCTQELVILDKDTVFDYITLPDVIVQKYRAGKIKHAHFADICRVELLYQHGGVWLDSTGFVVDKIPDWIINQDFFVYLAGSIYSYSFMQNCFIRARRGAYLLAAWRKMILDFWMNENSTCDYFMHQLMFKTLVETNPVAAKYFEQMPHVTQEPTHTLWWAYRDKPFDKDTFEKLTSGAFFQKTTYRGTNNIVPDSFADVMINKMYK